LSAQVKSGEAKGKKKVPEIEDLSNINKISTTYQQLQHINKIQQKNQQISKMM
jgi:hypothetical protein